MELSLRPPESRQLSVTPDEDGLQAAEWSEWSAGLAVRALRLFCTLEAETRPHRGKAQRRALLVLGLLNFQGKLEAGNRVATPPAVQLPPHLEEPQLRTLA